MNCTSSCSLPICCKCSTKTVVARTVGTMRVALRRDMCNERKAGENAAAAAAEEEENDLGRSGGPGDTRALTTNDAVDARRSNTVRAISFASVAEEPPAVNSGEAETFFFFVSLRTYEKWKMPA